jgi:hypothetical protein
VADAQSLIAHAIINPVTSPGNAPIQTAHNQVARLTYRPVEDTDTSTLTESAADELDGNTESPRHIDLTFASLRRQLRDIAASHQPRNRQCPTDQCPFMIPVALVHQKIQLTH